jgi:hypothetical protein
MLDKETAQDFAKKLKIDLFTIYREYLQLLFLKYFYNQKESEKIYFKGGTALRFLFDSFRFSEDLDFTSLLPESKIQILIKKTLQDLSKETERISFKKTETIPNSFSGRIFQKLPEFKFPLTIRLDFSFREKPFLPDTSYIETIFPVGPFPQVSHLKIEELLAEKVRAVLTRKRGRDIFDLYFLLSKKIPIDWKLVNKKMAFYKKRANLEKLIKAIKEFPQEEIKNDLTKFLPITHRGLVPKVKDLTLEKLKSL